MSAFIEDTIVAIATPPGVGGVGIVRVSGPHVPIVAQQLLAKLPSPRHATFSTFQFNNVVLDEGIALYFPAPNSFTGEDILELQGHGGPMVMDGLVKAVLQCDSAVRLAEPGEFSKRAFLNNRIDLTQAEAVADLIHATSQQAVRGALCSLKGEFSTRITDLVERVIELRMYVEATIDFSDEDIDFLAEGQIAEKLSKLQTDIQTIHACAQQGALLQEGMTLVLAGKPNVGKSSLLNRLSGEETAIVTDIAGTTRDLLKERIHIDGMPLHIIDTAGLRETDDIVEQEGVRRAKNAMAKADLIVYLLDANHTSLAEQAEAQQQLQQLQQELSPCPPVVKLYNKIDLMQQPAYLKQDTTNAAAEIGLSAKTGEGIPLLLTYLKQCMGYQQPTEGQFIARRRHLESLQQALYFIEQAINSLNQQQGIEWIAENLRQVQQALGEITGKFTTDDLLGRIFASFCIGK